MPEFIPNLISQKRLARDFGVPTGTVSSWESKLGINRRKRGVQFKTGADIPEDFKRHMKREKKEISLGIRQKYSSQDDLAFEYWVPTSIIKLWEKELKIDAD